MTQQVPRGPDHLFCPFWRMRQSKVCHTCPLWVQVRGTNPQTGQEVDQWQCSLSWLPMLLIECAQQSRQTGAAVESFRNQMVNQREVAAAMVDEIARRAIAARARGNDAPPVLEDDPDDGSR